MLGRDPAAPLSDVAAEAGLSRATVYRHFPNRESLEQAIREAALASASRTIADAQLGQDSASVALERAVQGLVRLGPRFAALLREGAAPDDEFLQRRDEALRPLLDVVHRAQAEDELDPSVDARWAYQALTALLVAAARASSTGTLAPDVAASLVCRTLFDGLRPPRLRRPATGRGA